MEITLKTTLASLMESRTREKNSRLLEQNKHFGREQRK